MLTKRGEHVSSKAKIEYTVQVWQEGKQFVAHAMPLDVMSCGPTPTAASQALREAVELYLVHVGVILPRVRPRGPFLCRST